MDLDSILIILPQTKIIIPFVFCWKFVSLVAFLVLFIPLHLPFNFLHPLLNLLIIVPFHHHPLISLTLTLVHLIIQLLTILTIKSLLHPITTPLPILTIIIIHPHLLPHTIRFISNYPNQSIHHLKLIATLSQLPILLILYLLIAIAIRRLLHSCY